MFFCRQAAAACCQAACGSAGWPALNAEAAAAAACLRAALSLTAELCIMEHSASEKLRFV